MPPVASVDFGMQCFEFSQSMLVEFLARHFFVSLKQCIDILQSGQNDIAYGQIHSVRQVLPQLADNQSILPNDFALVCFHLSHDQFESC